MNTDARSPAYTIRTERLVIRCWRPEDAPLLARAIAESIDHLLPWMPWAESEGEETLQTKIERLRTFRGKFDLDQDYIYAVFNAEETVVVGGTGLHPRIGPNGQEIGYWVHADHINKGYATEIAAALTRVGFEVLGMNRLEIRCDPENVRSAAIPGKLGYLLDGTLRQAITHPGRGAHDAMVWSMIADDYPSSIPAQTPVAAFDVMGRRLL